MKRLPALGLAALAVTAAGIAFAQKDADEAAAGAEAAAEAAEVESEAVEEAAADETDAIAEDYLDRTPVDCVSLSLVRETAIIDDGTILFYMRGGDVFLNVLERACIGLESSGRFLTETRTNRLCSIDMLQVFRQFAGSTMPGAFCRLGEFHPLTTAEAEQLEMDLEELAAARRSVVLTPIDPAAEPASDDAAP